MPVVVFLRYRVFLWTYILGSDKNQLHMLGVWGGGILGKKGGGVLQSRGIKLRIWRTVIGMTEESDRASPNITPACLS